MESYRFPLAKTFQQAQSKVKQMMNFAHDHQGVIMTKSPMWKKCHWSILLWFHAKTSQVNAREPTSVAHSCATHYPWQCSPAHRRCCNQKSLRLWVGSGTSCALHSRHSNLFPKLKELMLGWCLSSLEYLSTDFTRAIWQMNKSGVLDEIIILPKRWD